MKDLVNRFPISRVSLEFHNIVSRAKRRMELLASILLLILTLSPTDTLFGQQTAPACPGDVNLDEGRGPGDLALLSAHLSGERVLEGQALVNADVNLDRIVDVGDVTRLLQHTTGKFTLLPCGEFDPVEIACPKLSLGQASAAPLEEVSLGSLPEELKDPVLALVTETENDIGILAFVERLEDGSATLTVPFYPGANLDGGPVDIQVTDGFSDCPLTGFSIETIPTAPGEFSRVVDSLQEYVEERASELDLAVEDLVSGSPELPTAGIPLAIAQWLLDHPENPDSLRAISEGSAPFLEGDSDNTLLDAFSAQMDLVDLYRPRGTLSIEPTQESVDPAGCGESLENLDRCMRTAALAAGDLPVLTDPKKRKVALSILALKLYPASDNRDAQEGADLLQGIWAANEFSETVSFLSALAARNLLPTSFHSFKIEVDPESMEEDYDEQGKWKGELTARSFGFKFDVGRSTLRNYLRANLAAQKGQKAFELVEKVFFGEGEVDKKVQEVIYEGAKRIAPDAEEEPGNFEIPPETFGPITIKEGLTQEEWTEVEIQGDAVEQVDHYKYRPARASDGAEPTKIRVKIRTDEGRFGGLDSISADAGVEVLPIKLEISPVEQALYPGQQEVSFTVEVENAQFPEKVKVLDPQRGSARIEYQGENLHRVTYTAPAFTPQGFSESLTVRYSGDTGARRPAMNPPPREATADIRKSEVLLTGPGCVEPSSDDNRFTADVVGLDNQQVMWEASSGTMQSNGVFLAPPSPELDVRITATSVVDERVTGEAVVKVGGCKCWWTVDIGGRVTSGRSGVDAGTFLHNSETGEILVELFREENEGYIGLRFDSTEQAWNGGGAMPSGTLTVDGENFTGLFEVSETVLEAEVAGTVEENIVDGPNVERRPTSFYARFRIEHDPEFDLATFFQGYRVN